MDGVYMADKKELVAADESGTITLHYEDCTNCGGRVY
jgi:rRNA maturation protein Nop10